MTLQFLILMTGECLVYQMYGTRVKSVSSMKNEVVPAE